MYKMFLVAILLVASFTATQAQFFRPLAAPTHKMGLVAGAVDSSNLTQNAWRPIANLAAYSEPGSILMAGVGGGYQHLKWNTASATWSCVWSVNALAFAGGSTIPTSPASVVSIGVMGGLDNNLFMLGPVYNFGTKQLGIGFSIGFNFNNGAGL